jgi:hypothetical protein
MKPHYILTLALLAATTPVTNYTCTFTIKADNIRIHDSLETKLNKENPEKQDTQPLQKDIQKKLY